MLLFMRAPSLVVFDLDQTLVNRSGFAELFAQNAERVGVKYSQAIKSWNTSHGTPLEDQLKSLGVSPDKADACISRLFQEAESLPTELLPGALPLLRKLKSSGVKIALSTGSGQALAESALKETGIDGFFDMTLGSSRYCLKGAHHLPLILSQLGQSPDQAAVVGDGGSDMLFAKQANIAWRVGVPFSGEGCHSEQQLFKAGATHCTAGLPGAQGLFSL